MIEAIINGAGIAIGTGVGSTIGSYIANRHLIKNIEKLENKIKANKGQV
jgi:hypothetical protein